MPYLTKNEPGIGGKLKTTPEDFLVEEIPLYLPSGQGQHLYVLVEKKGISTFAAAKEIARALNISPKAIGYAGLKDANAVTRQTFSIDNVDPVRVEELNLSRIKILEINRHRNKLKLGHSSGNRFVIRVRNTIPNALSQATTTLLTLAEKGVPNFFGKQRFGVRNNTHTLGRLLLTGHVSEFVSEYLGRPQTNEAETVRAARTLVDEKRWADALKQWPSQLSDERRVLSAIEKVNGSYENVLKSIDRRMKNFFVSAFQSKLFNDLLTARLTSIDRLEAGDVAYIHQNGAAFIVEDAATEQPRVDQFEISPSGPLFGPKLLQAQGQPGQREQACLLEQNLSLESFKIPDIKLKGARRPYRIQVKNHKVWQDEEGLVASFELPPGAYATMVMAEVMKIS